MLALFDENNKPIFVTHISTGELNPDGTDATFCETATYTTDIRGNPLAEPETKADLRRGEDAARRVPPQAVRGRPARQPARRHEEPLVLQLRHRHPRGAERPDHPASHGCVRMSNSLADVFPTLVEKGNAVYVWGYDGREPEGYTEKESTAVVQPARPERHGQFDRKARQRLRKVTTPFRMLISTANLMIYPPTKRRQHQLRSGVHPCVSPIWVSHKSGR